MFEKITSVVKRLIGFGKSVVSEVDGTGSASRSIGLIVAVVSMGALVAQVCIHHALPAPEQLYGLSSLVAAGSGAYAANKVGGTKPPSQPSQPSRPNQPNQPSQAAQPTIVTPPEGGH